MQTTRRPSVQSVLLHGLVTDVLELGRRPRGRARRFRRTIRALYRSATFSATADVVRRVTEPTNRTARLAIVLAARSQGLPVETGDLDQLRRAIDRDAPDLGPLLTRVLERLVQLYGRDAVRVVLPR